MAQFAFGDCTMMAVSSLWSGTLFLDQGRLAVITLALGAMPAVLVYMARRRRWRPMALGVTGMSVLLVLISIAYLDHSCTSAANQLATGSGVADAGNGSTIDMHALVLGAIIVIGWGILAGQLFAWLAPAGRRAGQDG